MGPYWVGAFRKTTQRNESKPRTGTRPAEAKRWIGEEVARGRDGGSEAGSGVGARETERDRGTGCSDIQAHGRPSVGFFRLSPLDNLVGHLLHRQPHSAHEPNHNPGVAEALERPRERPFRVDVAEALDRLVG